MADSADNPAALDEFFRRWEASGAAERANYSMFLNESDSADRKKEHQPVKTPVETRVETPHRILELLRASPEMTLAEVAAVIGKSLSTVERASTNW